jgi:hypothetical protein
MSKQRQQHAGVAMHTRAAHGVAAERLDRDNLVMYYPIKAHLATYQPVLSLFELADFLYGPVWAASLVAAVFALRERIGERTPRRMTLALLAALVAAGAMVGVACIRSANRQYLLLHPELSDDLSTTLLMAWATIVAGMIATGWHFLGWTLVLVGSSGWASCRLPRGLSVLYLVAGIASLFVYVLPDMEGNVVALGVVVSIWQGIVLWKAEPGETQAPEISASQPDQI